MLDNQILLTTPSYPYPTLPGNDSLTDATGQRFTKGDGIFTVYSHTHCFANHILAQNIELPAVLLEYPRWGDFTAEVDRGYPIIGISAFPVHLDTVIKMCRYIRQRSPASKILLGSYAGQAFQASYDLATQRQYVDHVVHGEGVRFLRRLLGEPEDRPVRQALMPKAGGTLPFLSKYPRGTVGFLVSGLGCIGGCDFCSTTAMFDRQRIQMLSPAELVEHMHLYYQHFPNVRQVFVVEEDHFRYPTYLHETREYWMGHPEMMERMDWFAFGSIDHIGKFARTYGWDALAETGIGAVFIGVESKFAGEHGYDKRDEIDAREVFTRLHGLGIRTVGAWMCGWDFHHHGNMIEDLNYFVSLYPTYQQLTRVSPFPGTALWERLREQGRVLEVPWEDVHFWSGAQRNVALETHETLNLTEQGYDLIYRTWGPSILRRLDVQLSGYEYCRRSDNPILRRHKARFFKQQCGLFWTFLPALDRFAPNGIVRRRGRKLDERFRAVIGEPTPVMWTLARSIEALATAFRFHELFDPLNRHPKEEPFKRYVYPARHGAARGADGSGPGGGSGAGNGSGGSNGGNGSNGAVPYRVEAPSSRGLRVRVEQQREALQFAAMEVSMRALRQVRRGRGDPELDDYLINLVGTRSFGFGF